MPGVYGKVIMIALFLRRVVDEDSIIDGKNLNIVTLLLEFHQAFSFEWLFSLRKLLKKTPKIMWTPL